MDGDLQRVTSLLQKGTDPNLRDSAGYTALVSLLGTDMDTNTSQSVLSQTQIFANIKNSSGMRKCFFKYSTSNLNIHMAMQTDMTV